mmetsp:Transcript_114463/g.199095  ORF Transcript_114463/g.199095 Transcript_114463/m.199095 type:complete len:94 (-) Transcript_114463:931-1212(-)
MSNVLPRPVSPTLIVNIVVTAIRTVVDVDDTSRGAVSQQLLKRFGPEPPPGSYVDPAGRTVVPVVPAVSDDTDPNTWPPWYVPRAPPTLPSWW